MWICSLCSLVSTKDLWEISPLTQYFSLFRYSSSNSCSVWRGAAQPLVHRHGGPLRPPRQAQQDLGDPRRVRHQGRGGGATRVGDLQSGPHHHTSRFQVSLEDAAMSRVVCPQLTTCHMFKHGMLFSFIVCQTIYSDDSFTFMWEFLVPTFAFITYHCVFICNDYPNYNSFSYLRQ